MSESERKFTPPEAVPDDQPAPEANPGTPDTTGQLDEDAAWREAWELYDDAHLLAESRALAGVRERIARLGEEGVEFNEQEVEDREQRATAHLYGKEEGEQERYKIAPADALHALGDPKVEKTTEAASPEAPPPEPVPESAPDKDDFAYELQMEARWLGLLDHRQKELEGGREMTTDELATLWKEQYSKEPAPAEMLEDASSLVGDALALQTADAIRDLEAIKGRELTPTEAGEVTHEVTQRWPEKKYLNHVRGERWALRPYTTETLVEQEEKAKLGDEERVQYDRRVRFDNFSKDLQDATVRQAEAEARELYQEARRLDAEDYAASHERPLSPEEQRDIVERWDAKTASPEAIERAADIRRQWQEAADGPRRFEAFLADVTPAERFRVRELTDELRYAAALQLAGRNGTESMVPFDESIIREVGAELQADAAAAQESILRPETVERLQADRRDIVERLAFEAAGERDVPTAQQFQQARERYRKILRTGNPDFEGQVTDKDRAIFQEGLAGNLKRTWHNFRGKGGPRDQARVGAIFVGSAIGASIFGPLALTYPAFELARFGGREIYKAYTRRRVNRQALAQR